MAYVTLFAVDFLNTLGYIYVVGPRVGFGKAMMSVVQLNAVAMDMHRKVRQYVMATEADCVITFGHVSMPKGDIELVICPSPRKSNYDVYMVMLHEISTGRSAGCWKVPFVGVQAMVELWAAM